jgi:hypothetical protein
LIAIYKKGCNNHIVRIGDRYDKFELFWDKNCGDIGVPGCGVS